MTLAVQTFSLMNEHAGSVANTLVPLIAARVVNSLVRFGLLTTVLHHC